MTPERDRPHSPPPGTRCHRPWTGFELFDHLGDVRPCCWGKVSCGNVNSARPEEIWSGPGFRFYRERMAAGDVDAICKPDCPILLGLYEEPLPARPARSGAGLDPPLFLRVVPTTACNLRCPMCYQLDDPPPALPADLAESLDPWLRSAHELLVLGGEPFVAKECLHWIESIVPEAYPALGLAAITNGYAISSAALALLAERRWHWILVSIDAASPAVYRRVRGGDYHVLLEGLDRLAELRAAAATPFELRFGFTLQNDNLDDAIPFLDLCADFDAVPQFTTVFGDWHDQTPRSAAERWQFVAALEALDKELWSRGFDARLVAPAIARLKVSEGARPSAAARPFGFLYVDDTDEGRLALARGLRRLDRLTEVVVVGLGERSLDDAFTRSVLAERGRTGRSTILSGSNGAAWAPRLGDAWQSELLVALPPRAAPASVTELVARLRTERARSLMHPRRLTFEIGGTLAAAWPEVAEALRGSRWPGFGIRLPYRIDGAAASAVEWDAFASRVRAFGEGEGWRFQGGDPAPVDLGLERYDQFPEIEVLIDTRGAGAPSLALVSPMYNRSRELATFLCSLVAALPAFSIEVILVDDGSSDDTAAIARRFAEDLRGRLGVAVIRLARCTPYRAGTFTFRAGAARQCGCDVARAPVLLFVDPDQRIGKGLFEQHLRWSEAGFDVVLGDRRHDGPPAPTPEWAHWTELRRAPLNAYEHWWLSFYTGNAAVSAAALRAAGGFDESLQYWGLDDTDLGYRLARSGARFWHTPRAVVHHLAVPDSGGGVTRAQRHRAFWLHMEVLYRKYIDSGIMRAYRFLQQGESP